MLGAKQRLAEMLEGHARDDDGRAQAALQLLQEAYEVAKEAGCRCEISRRGRIVLAVAIPNTVFDVFVVTEDGYIHIGAQLKEMDELGGLLYDPVGQRFIGEDRETPAVDVLADAIASRLEHQIKARRGSR